MAKPPETAPEDGGRGFKSDVVRIPSSCVHGSCPPHGGMGNISRPPQWGTASWTLEPNCEGLKIALKRSHTLSNGTLEAAGVSRSHC